LSQQSSSSRTLLYFPTSEDFTYLGYGGAKVCIS
jgi:hypothetical protein